MRKILFITFIFLSFVSCERRVKFNKDYWKNYPNERYRMVEDLLKSKILIGKSKDEVRMLLTNDCKYCDDDSDNWMYFLGEGFHKLDRKWEVMDIEFREDRVIIVIIRE